MWILDSTDPAYPLKLRLTAGVVKTIGRGATSDFVVDGSFLSRVHCRLTATSKNLVVEDLKSTNGTFVNDARVGRASLMSGDRLRLGRIEFEVSTN